MNTLVAPKLLQKKRMFKKVKNLIDLKKLRYLRFALSVPSGLSMRKGLIFCFNEKEISKNLFIFEKKSGDK